MSLLALGSSDAEAKKPKKKKAPKVEAPFDKEAAFAALSAIDVSACRKDEGPTGEGHVVVTFAPSGNAKAVWADAAPYTGTPVGRCVEKAFKKTKVPAFAGDPVSVGKKFHID
jgi:hypothetical protein